MKQVQNLNNAGVVSNELSLLDWTSYAFKSSGQGLLKDEMMTEETSEHFQEAYDSMKKIMDSIKRMAVSCKADITSGTKEMVRKANAACIDFEAKHAGNIFKCLLDPQEFTNEEAKQRLQQATEPFAILIDMEADIKALQAAKRKGDK